MYTCAKERFYTAKPKYRVRRGPAQFDSVRMTSTIDYDRATYAYPTALVAPPLILQERAEKSHKCTTNLGSLYAEQLWNETKSGVICEAPYKCDDTFLSNSTSLLSCRARNAPETFFGQIPLLLDGRDQFYEFLQSVTDSEILVRDGENYVTNDFLDGQTKSVQVAMVAFSPEYGIASTISITALLETDVKVDFSVQHYASLEGEELRQFEIVSFTGLALAVVILLEKIATFAHLQLRKPDKTGRIVITPEGRNNIQGFIVDLVIQVILPFAYFVVRLLQVQDSKNSIQRTVGSEGLTGVPWSSRNVVMEDKITQFFDGLTKFQQQLLTEDLMGYFYFILATASLLRLIAQTGAHPRTAILVNTLINAADDLWHFLILFVILNGGFIALAQAQFAGQRDEFATIGSSFELLWNLLIGNMMDSGAIPSSFWTYTPTIAIYLLLYQFIIFMVCFVCNCFLDVLLVSEGRQSSSSRFPSLSLCPTL
jgi:hypothetical protein